MNEVEAGLGQRERMLTISVQALQDRIHYDNMKKVNIPENRAFQCATSHVDVMSK